jgi:hypothetical protein
LICAVSPTLQDDDDYSELSPLSLAMAVAEDEVGIDVVAIFRKLGREEAAIFKDWPVHGCKVMRLPGGEQTIDDLT